MTDNNKGWWEMAQALISAGDPRLALALTLSQTQQSSNPAAQYPLSDAIKRIAGSYDSLYGGGSRSRPGVRQQRNGGQTSSAGSTYSVSKGLDGIYMQKLNERSEDDYRRKQRSLDLALERESKRKEMMDRINIMRQLFGSTGMRGQMNGRRTTTVADQLVNNAGRHETRPTTTTVTESMDWERLLPILMG